MVSTGWLGNFHLDWPHDHIEGTQMEDSNMSYRETLKSLHLKWWEKYAVLNHAISPVTVLLKGIMQAKQVSTDFSHIISFHADDWYIYKYISDWTYYYTLSNHFGCANYTFNGIYWSWFGILNEIINNYRQEKGRIIIDNNRYVIGTTEKVMFQPILQ